MENHQSSEEAELLQYIYGYRQTQLIYVAAELKIADLLQDGPKTSAYLAELTNTHEPSLYRVLRALTTIRLFKESEQGFELTDMSSLLLADAPNSFRAIALMRGEEVNWTPWGELLYAVKTGNSPFQKVFGMDLFEYYETHPISGQNFHDGMTVMTRQDVQAILKTYDFSAAKTIVDVGGGFGKLLFGILEQYPQARGILYDLPHVLDGAYPLRTQYRLDDRCDIVGGQFFERVPEGGDYYLMKRIMHDWDDDRCVQILQNCRRAMQPGGKVVIFETMVLDDFENTEGKVNDIHMMVVCPGGKERTAKEFAAVLESAGLRLNRIIPTGSGIYAVEGIRK